jgi:hypothetical protein
MSKYANWESKTDGPEAYAPMRWQEDRKAEPHAHPLDAASAEGRPDQSGGRRRYVETRQQVDVVPPDEDFEIRPFPLRPAQELDLRAGERLLRGGRWSHGAAALGRFGLQTTIAAVVAVVLVERLPWPTWINYDKPDKSDRYSKNERHETSGPANAPKASVGGVTRTATEQSVQAVPQRAVNAGRRGQAGENPPLGVSSVGATATRPVVVTPAPAVGAKATPEPLLHLEPGEITSLLVRGEDLMKSGDVTAARLPLRRAAAAGDPRAALLLGATYDPTVLEKLGVHGLVADVALARVWYEKAKDFGSGEARHRIDVLASRTR